VIAGLEAVVIDLVEVDFAREVVRSDEAFFDVPGEVATIEEAEVAEAEEEDEAVGVVGFVFGLVGGECWVVRVCGCAGRGGDHFLIGGEDFQGEGRGAWELFEGDGSAWSEDDSVFDFGIAIGA
jgi:hypothetical protein